MPYRFSFTKTTLVLFSLLLHLTLLGSTSAFAGKFPKIFGYNEVIENDMSLLPQWASVRHRHPVEDFTPNNEKLQKWMGFLDSLKHLSSREQIDKINWYANTKKYIIDLRNYGKDDYWAIVWEFLENNGDCEDYSITKFFSLRQLGFAEDDLRILILQDTNLGVAHAVLTVSIDGDVLILDNQSTEVLSHRDIVHYVPLYSVNEHKWWLHLPPGL